MGKKNRRRNPNNAASATANATANATDNAFVLSPATIKLGSLYSASSGTNPCYHGSTVDKFQPDNEYMKAVEEYLNNCQETSLLNSQDAQLHAGKYNEDYRHLINNPEFCLFIVAICTQYYLASSESPVLHENRQFRCLLFLGYECIKPTGDKRSKFNRDACTERGVINILVRETKTHCKCMNEAKDIAKKMDKMGQCHGCRNDFPKETLRLCDGCQFWKYHDRKCQLRYWPIHEADCKQMQNDMQVRVRLDRMKLKLEQGKMQNDMQVRVLLDRMKLEMEQVKRNEE